MKLVLDPGVISVWVAVIMRRTFLPDKELKSVGREPWGKQGSAVSCEPYFSSWKKKKKKKTTTQVLAWGSCAREITVLLRKQRKISTNNDTHEINGLSSPLTSLERSHRRTVYPDGLGQTFPWWSVRGFDDTQVIVMFRLIGSRDGEETLILMKWKERSHDCFNPWSREKSWTGGRRSSCSHPEAGLACRCWSRASQLRTTYV